MIKRARGRLDIGAGAGSARTRPSLALVALWAACTLSGCVGPGLDPPGDDADDVLTPTNGGASGTGTGGRAATGGAPGAHGGTGAISGSGGSAVVGAGGSTGSGGQGGASEDAGVPDGGSDAAIDEDDAGVIR